jgi:1-acyl-sn-glycerol-3-phosphate acyltransferase
MIFARSTLFMAWFALVTTLLSLAFLPVLMLPRGAAVWLARSWSRASLWGLKVFAGIGFEIRGAAPRGPVLVASKHMSMWDTLGLYLALESPAVVLKRSLLYIPFYGWFLWKAAAIPIDRGAGAGALRKMQAAAQKVLAAGRPILIFPEGTRKKPGAAPDYKPGVAGLYTMLDVACVPVALNSGVYWTGFRKLPGTIVLEFLEPIPTGLKRAAFMALLEERIETATHRLLP